jgi:hypothetical protein
LTVRSFITFLGLFLIAAFGSAATTRPNALAQEHTYNSTKGEYIVDFPSPVWKLVDEPDDVHQHTEFVYGDRNDGYLKVRKESLEQGTTIQEFAHRDLDQRERFRPGFVIGKEEPFSGRLAGVTASYEYTNAGKPMAGRSYYLQGDSNTVYVLRFTGMRDKLGRIRNQTDSIARSLRSK